ncbi:hypothetical protein BC938DRAFT_477389, partial [Jimgerdemannia flammicorona]
MMVHPTTKDIIYISALAIDGIKANCYGRASHAAGVVPSHRSSLKAGKTVNCILFTSTDCFPNHAIPPPSLQANIIPAHASMFFLARSFRSFQLEELKPCIEACFRIVCGRKFQAT